MPSNEHIFLCGETAKGQSLGANTYALSLHGLDPNITLRIEDVVNGRVKVSQMAAQNVATLGLARLPRE